MQLHTLKSKTKKKASPRIGRGGKRGTYSGRGQKGQRSRAGRRIRPAERDLIMRLPKRRGFRNKPTSVKPMIINLRVLMNKLKPVLSDKKPVIDRKFLEEIGVLPAGYKGEIKILGNGDINFPATFKGFDVSKSVRIKVEKAGGKVE